MFKKYMYYNKAMLSFETRKTQTQYKSKMMLFS